MKKLISLVLAITLAAELSIPALATEAAAFSLIVPDNWELKVGDSRTVDYVFAEGTENRQISWHTQDSSIATVDEWGRVTGVSEGETSLIATPADTSIQAATAIVHVVTNPTLGAPHSAAVNYSGKAITEVANLQKLVTRYPIGDPNIPGNIGSIITGNDYTTYQTATTSDGAVWTVTAYGVKRTCSNAPTKRDAEQRFMGDRYFYEKDTTSPHVLGIAADGAKGIWTIMATGVTHIEMAGMDGTDKAALMSETTQKDVARRGLVSDASSSDGGETWTPNVTDNDGLWTSMYGAGELMRYAVLRSDPTATTAEIVEARNCALSATEAVLLLANISMRGGDVEAYVKRFSDGGYDMYKNMPIYNDNGKSLSGSTLIAGGDYSLSIPDKSPSMYHFSDLGRLITPYSEGSWAIPAANDGNTYAKQSRSLGGFIARTYYIEGVDAGNTDGFYYALNDDGTSTAVSSEPQEINGENFIGTTTIKDNVGTNIKTDSLMGRLWNDVIGADVDLASVTYKGDTSTDEIIGHLFLYKLAYDILGAEDAELRQIISTTMNNFARHISDNSYMLVDITGQPTTWGKMNRQYFYTYRWGASSSPLTAGVLLCVFKTAAYVTGYQKWEDEYQLAARISDSYRYADVMTGYTDRGNEFLDLYAAPLLGNTLGTCTLSTYLSGVEYDKELEFLTRTFAQYSDEEMAMLSFYLLFQMETDTQLLGAYRKALDEWWVSMKYSENPLWYYIYQLAYPDSVITDAYGNNILETAAWSLSRHPIDTRKWCASNSERDDIMIFNLEDYSAALATRGGISIKKTELPPTAIGAEGIIGILLYGGITNGSYDLSSVKGPSGTLSVEYAVAAPDERALHKYNGSSYILDTDYNPNEMEGSTTYTLPYWLGRYHGMLTPPVVESYTPDVHPVIKKAPTPASELFGDVPADAWYHDSVTYVVDAGLFEGTAEKVFSPKAEMTRGMLMTVLMRHSGQTKAEGNMLFSDVEKTDYFYTPVLWGVSNGICKGVTDTLFAPETPVTREQAITMLYRYAKSLGTVSAGADYSGYADAGAVSAYASEAMAWAVGAGIVTGREGNRLAPGETITRAEVAALMQRFSKL